MSDFVARVKFLNTIGLADADVASSLKGQKDLMERQVADLQNSKIQAEALEFEMKARRIEVTLRIEERQKMMTAAQRDLLTLLDKEAGRRSADESAIFADVLSGASKAGIVVEPGSPVETALAYHGVPYLWAGATPSGFDCSGLILYVFEQHGVTLPHYSGSQFLLGTKVALRTCSPTTSSSSAARSTTWACTSAAATSSTRRAPVTSSRSPSSPTRTDFAGARRYPWAYRVGPPLNAVTHHGQRTHQGSLAPGSLPLDSSKAPPGGAFVLGGSVSRTPMSGKIHVLCSRARRDEPV